MVIMHMVCLSARSSQSRLFEREDIRAVPGLELFQISAVVVRPLTRADQPDCMSVVHLNVSQIMDVVFPAA